MNTKICLQNHLDFLIYCVKYSLIFNLPYIYIFFIPNTFGNVFL